MKSNMKFKLESDLQLLRLLPLCRHDVLAVQIGLLQHQTLEVAAALEEDLQAGTADARAEIHAQHLFK